MRELDRAVKCARLPFTLVGDRYEMTVEIANAALPAWRWQEAYGDVVSEAAFTAGALDFRWVPREWGVVFEVAFSDADSWLDFLALTVVRAALDAVPDRVNGIVFSRGWGGSAPAGAPRKPRPIAGAGAAELPLPELEPDDVDEPVRHVVIVGGGEHGDIAERRAG